VTENQNQSCFTKHKNNLFQNHISSTNYVKNQN